MTYRRPAVLLAACSGVSLGDINGDIKADLLAGSDAVTAHTHVGTTGRPYFGANYTD